MKRNIGYLVLCLGLATSIITSLFIGTSNIGLSEVINNWLGEENTSVELIVNQIRLPRTILAITIGFGLGIAGAAMQGFLRNPLAEPGVVGLSAASALFAVIALQYGGEIAGASWSPFGYLKIGILPIAALLGAGLAALLLFLFGGVGNTERLILVGLGISALSAAGVSLALNLSPNPFAGYETMRWLMGSLANRSFDHVALSLPFIIVGALLIFTQARALDALSLGEHTANSMGINLKYFTFTLIAAIAMIVGASVAVAGAIGFIGLIVPHMLRPIMGSMPSGLLLASGLGGAVLLLMADISTRMILPIGKELELGVVTALLGAPIFLHLVISGRR